MFKKTQKYLLLNYPLLWNTKVIPLTAFLVLAHIVYFFFGYSNGTLDFNETEQNYRSQADDLVLFFSVLISILTLIIWLVFYFKNNAFKAFYPKGNFSLLKEWLLLFFISSLLCSFFVTYQYGDDCKVRSYFSEKEAMKRCDIISKASIFYGEGFDEPKYKDSLINDTLRRIDLKFVRFNKQKYSLTSLYNKSIENFPFHDAAWDSLTKIKVKTWLLNQNQDSVKAVMKSYIAIVNHHHLIGNINEEKWFSIVYNPPTFEQKRIVAEKEKELYSQQYDYANGPAIAESDLPRKIDTLNQFIRMINKEKYVVNKNYLPANKLAFNYQKIANSYVNPTVSFTMILVVFYFAIGLSILLFSFRVTSGRNWLITLVAMGVINILLGIFSAILSEANFYLAGLIILFLGLFGYFMIVLVRKTKKGISGITLNGLLWMLPAFVPLLCAATLQFLEWKYNCYGSYSTGFDCYSLHPFMKFLKENVELIMWLNIPFIIVMMAFLSVKIKQWRALADS
jgi:hypothetical protein